MLTNNAKPILPLIFQFVRELRRKKIFSSGLWLILGILIFTVLPINMTAKAENVISDTTILATINEDTIYVRDIDNLIIDFHNQKGGQRLKQFDTRKLFNKIINDLLLTQEAFYLELDKEPWLVSEVEEHQINKAIELFLRDKYKPNLKIDSTEILDYFNKYYSRMQLRTACFLTKEEAGTIAASIRSGADMDSIAKELSLDSHRLKGGLRNFSYYGDIEDIFRVQGDKLKIGEISNPISYRDVYCIVRLEKLAEPDPADLPGLARKINSVLRYWKNETISTNFFDSLIHLYTVKEDASILGEILADSSKLFTPEYMNGSKEIALSGLNGFSMNDDQLRKIISYGAMTTAQDPYDSIYTRGIRKAKIELALKAATKEADYPKRSEIVRLSQQFLDSSLIEVYIKQTILPGISIEFEEINQYYQSNLENYRLPSKYQFNRIIFSDDTLAQSAYLRIQQGANFRFAAKQFAGELATSDENAEWLELDNFPSKLQKEIVAANISECIAPVSTSEGWLLLQLKSIRKGDIKPLQDVSKDVRSVIFGRKFGELMDETIDLLKSNSIIWRNEIAIDQYFGDKTSENGNKK